MYELHVCITYELQVRAGTAIALRLTAPWVHSGRIIILDSGFASLKAPKALAEVGLHMIGNVKTAHSDFPKKWLCLKGEMVLVLVIQ